MTWINRVRFGDCRESMRAMIGAGVRVNCIVTSPPYWGLRDYKIPPTVWGGDAAHAHVFATEDVDTEVGKGNWTQAVNGRGEVQGDIAGFREPVRAVAKRGFCTCGAWLGNLGLEPDYRMFIAHMVEVFGLVRELLADDGVCFLNLGDSYSSGGRTTRDPGKLMIHAPFEGEAFADGLRPGHQDGIKPKDMCMIPARTAIALQDDGWYLRSAMPWLKRNGMPDSVTDRPSQSIEYVYMLTKRERYFWDGEAVKVRSSNGTHERNGWKTPDGWDTGSGEGGHGGFHKAGREKGHLPGNKTHRGAAAYEAGDEHHRTKAGLVAYAERQRKLAEAGSGTKNNDSMDDALAVMPSARNFRVTDPFFNSWQGMWTDDAGDPLAMIVNTKGYKGAHFATYPAELVRPLILAATSAHGHCQKCGAGWKRVTEKGAADLDHQRACGGDSAGEYNGEPTKEYAGTGAQDPSAVKARVLDGMREKITTGWKSACKCGIEPGPAVVLDPFIGSGTTGEIAQQLGRNWIGCDIAEHYEPLQRERTAQLGMAL